jgi:serine/threonine-protein kinase HipA
VAHERLLHLDVGTQGKLATLDNALSGFAAFTPSRARALEIIRRVWGEVRQWKTTFEEYGADGHLLEQLDGAIRALEHIAGAGLAREVRGGD